MFEELWVESRNPSLLPLVLRGVGYSVGGKLLLQGIDLCLRGGHVSVIMGANGAGKSLILKLLHGLLEADAGSICGGGQEFQRFHRGHNFATAIVLQNPVVFRRNVAANLRLVLRHSGLPRKLWDRAVDVCLDWANLLALKGQAAHSLSGGERQCLSLARSLMMRPQILLLDEPCANLDPRATQRVEDLITKAARAGVKICLVTHDSAQARRLADEIIFIHEGQLCEVTGAREFFVKPRSLAARAYMRGELLL